MGEIGDKASWEPLGPLQAGDDGGLTQGSERRGQINRNNTIWLGDWLLE